MKAPLLVAPLEEARYPEWNALVAASPDGSPYATSDYLDLLCRAAGGRFRILGCRRGDELIGGTPLYETDGPAGVSVGPRLLLYYLGPVFRRFGSKYPSLETARLVETQGALADGLARQGFAKVTLKGRHTVSDLRAFLARGWSAWPSYTYLVPLKDLEQQRVRVEQNLRRLIDRCGDESLTVTEDEDIDSFLRLHRLTMEHHGAPAYLPDAAFRRWFELVKQRRLGSLFHARLPDGASIAAQLVLAGAHPVSHTVSAATDPAQRRLGAAAFLRWCVFERLAGQGYEANDLTDAALNPVTHFKSQFGGELVVNLVVETPGTWRWRATTATANAYRRARRLGGAALRRIRR